MLSQEILGYQPPWGMDGQRGFGMVGLSFRNILLALLDTGNEVG